ncbi:hypothetical protein J2847_002960 [Azospirillum agricola]|uniref:hypothetical protein n=1 Tax=Azospirillum agricola TaxID=1720247 RepID=UPI001AE10F6C|nr:hypothetical protein [Azospirillum agricola]MBP2229661.1 hypothetical protein [Azospirillum agricola]
MLRSYQSRQIDKKGERIVLSRDGAADVIIKAKVHELGSDTLAGAVAQRLFRVIIADETLKATAFPPDGPRKGDQVVINPTLVNGQWTGVGTMLTVERPGYRGAGNGWRMEAKG